MWYIYLINPFSAFLWSLFNLKNKHAENILWLFVTFIGLTWSLRPGSSSDSVRYMERVYFLHHSNYTFLEYYAQSGDIDFFSHLLAFIVSRLTDFGWVLMIIQALIFGFFFSRNMSFVFNRLKGKIKLFTWVLFLTFFIVVPMWSFNGFRFWTATHIFVYGLLPFLFDGKKKSLFWCFLTPFVFHYAFIVPVLVLSVFLVLKNRFNIYFGFFVFSLIFAEFNLQQFNFYIDAYAPKQFQERSIGYRSVSNYEQKQDAADKGVLDSEKSWHAILYKKSLIWVIYLFVFHFYFKRKQMEKIYPRLNYIFSFSLLFMGFANIFSNLPSGGRYLFVGTLVILPLVIIYTQNSVSDKWSRRIAMSVSPLLLFYFIVSAREGFYFMSVITIIGNPLIAPLTIGENIPLDMLIK